MPYVVAISAGFACGGFCKLFGCDWIAFLFASLCAFADFRTRACCIEFGINVYMSIAIAAFVSTCLAFLTSFSRLSDTPYHPLLACALFIVPGVPLINFVDDMIDNYIQMGGTCHLHLNASCIDYLLYYFGSSCGQYLCSSLHCERPSALFV